MGLASQAVQLATDLVAGLGYWGLAAGLVIDSAGVPIPSEVLLPLAGILANQGRFGLIEVIVIGTLAQTAGAALAYWIGSTGGLAVVKKYGKFVLFNNRELRKTQEWFEKYGSWLALVGRCVPVIRTYVGYPAGLAKMRFGRFLAASFVGSLVWTVFLVWIGYAVPSKLATVDKILHQFAALIITAAVGFTGWHILHRVKNRTGLGGGH